MINRLIEPTRGRIEIDGEDVSLKPATDLRRGIGYVIQQVGLFPHRTVLENIATDPAIYNNTFGDQKTIEFGPLLGEALSAREVDVVVWNTTAPQIEAAGFKLLESTRACSRFRTSRRSS